MERSGEKLWRALIVYTLKKHGTWKKLCSSFIIFLYFLLSSLIFLILTHLLDLKCYTSSIPFFFTRCFLFFKFISENIIPCLHWSLFLFSSNLFIFHSFLSLFFFFSFSSFHFFPHQFY